MDIYEYIIKDHRKVSDLFTQFEEASSEERKIQIIELLIKELFVHLEAEEATFYKALENYESSKPSVMHGEKEHAEIEALINTLKTVDSIENLDEKVKKLKKLVDHHVDDEENVIHKEAKKVLSEEEAIALKEQMHDYKNNLL
jgi:hemerythrin superfamily protein